MNMNQATILIYIFIIVAQVALFYSNIKQRRSNERKTNRYQGSRVKRGNR